LIFFFACAAAAANLAIWREGKGRVVLDRIAALSEAMRTEMLNLRDHPAFENHRQVGVIAALDMKVY
jgi:adenosylmethionine-8-amino-7-oxononanoate aminotransferase